MARGFAYVAGFVYVVLGVVGFAVTGFEHWVEADTDTYIAWFRLNSTLNLVHAALGTVLLWAGTEPPGAVRPVVTTVGLVFLVFGVAGFALTGNAEWNVLALNRADGVLYLATGVAALAAARDARTAPAT
ncbi:MAG: DUF4383 domain-containing protein [Actinobacteria bacterium]|nr:DUF4383 domain-containing protein [Actinomycetota bacterium]